METTQWQSSMGEAELPMPANNRKRIVLSPAERQEEKLRDEDPPSDGWEQVTSKSQQKKTERKGETEAPEKQTIVCSQRRRNQKLDRSFS